MLASQVQGLFQISPTLMNLAFGGVVWMGPQIVRNSIITGKLFTGREIYLICPKIIVVELLLLN